LNAKQKGRKLEGKKVWNKFILKLYPCTYFIYIYKTIVYSYIYAWFGLIGSLEVGFLEVDCYVSLKKW
jgi:hypothetical protein